MSAVLAAPSATAGTGAGGTSGRITGAGAGRVAGGGTTTAWLPGGKATLWAGGLTAAGLLLFSGSQFSNLVAAS
ncbi:MAG: hypothetical protein MUD11_09500, partial [Rhodobacteraceae bacterium]|nr:hypothetical protein [Paracoccaceae bacterium]